MAYIYKITNKINDKIYIGKTESSIEKRWKEHLGDFGKKRTEKRPLYEAMNKYGVENFSIHLIEETNQPEEREKFYINQYRTYIGFEDCNGYNATLGGDGKTYAFQDLESIELLIKMYNDGYNSIGMAKVLNLDQNTVLSKLKSLGFEVSYNRVRRKAVSQIDKQTNEVIQEFESVEAAAISLGSKTYKGHICQVCSGERKSAYGYKWKYVSED